MYEVYTYLFHRYIHYICDKSSRYIPFSFLSVKIFGLDDMFLYILSKCTLYKLNRTLLWIAERLLSIFQAGIEHLMDPMALWMLMTKCNIS